MLCLQPACVRPEIDLTIAISPRNGMPINTTRTAKKVQSCPSFEHLSHSSRSCSHIHLVLWSRHREHYAGFQQVSTKVESDSEPLCALAFGSGQARPLKTSLSFWLAARDCLHRQMTPRRCLKHHRDAEWEMDSEQARRDISHALIAVP